MGAASQPRHRQPSAAEETDEEQEGGEGMERRAFKCQVTDVFPFRRKVSLLLSHFFWGKARGGR